MKQALLFALFVSILPAWSADHWKKIDQDGPLSLYESEVPGSDLLAFKMEADFPYPLKEIASVLMDYEHAKDWIGHLEEYRMVRRDTPEHYFAYAHIGTPFVLKDRDFMTEVTIEIRAPEKTVELSTHSVDTPDAPKTDYVRGEILHSRYVMTELDATHTHVIAESHVDPRGSVPKWIVNIFQRSFPKQAYEALLARLAKPRPAPPADVTEIIGRIGF